MLQIHAQINKNVIEPMLKPMQIERKLVKFRKGINKIMHTPIRFQNVTLSTKSVRSEYHINDNNHVGIITKVSTLKGGATTRIETYANKTRVLVFTNTEDVFLKPYKKTMHT